MHLQFFNSVAFPPSPNTLFSLEATSCKDFVMFQDLTSRKKLSQKPPQIKHKSNLLNVKVQVCLYPFLIFVFFLRVSFCTINMRTFEAKRNFFYDAIMGTQNKEVAAKSWNFFEVWILRHRASSFVALNMRQRCFCKQILQVACNFQKREASYHVSHKRNFQAKLFFDPSKLMHFDSFLNLKS